MRTVDLVDAKAHLGALVDRAAAGETIEITRRGRPVARLTAVPTPRRPVDAALLRSLTSDMPPLPHSASEPVRAMRDTDRY